MIDRQMEGEIQILRNEFPVIAILGPRQSGKTTLSKKIFNDYEYVSFEDYDVRMFAESDPRGFLSRYSRDVIFDEIQRVPPILSYLQTHVDQHQGNGRIVITGSHNFLLMEQISQSLAGRVGITKLLPFSISELTDWKLDLNEFIFKGFYPRIYDQKIRPESFYSNYISTYIEKDIRQIRRITKLDVFIKFMKLLAGRTGQELNLLALGEETGVSHNTIMEWISVLEASFIVYRLKPFHKNYNKRLVKRSKIYFTDTGLVCSLLGIKKQEEFDYHFLKGGIFETFIINEFLKLNYNLGEKYEMYFWRDNHRKEIDLILDFGLKQLAVEIKSGKTVNDRFFSGLKYWKNLTNTENENLFLIYGGTENYVRSQINIVSWKSILNKIVSRQL